MVGAVRFQVIPSITGNTYQLVIDEAVTLPSKQQQSVLYLLLFVVFKFVLSGCEDDTLLDSRSQTTIDCIVVRLERYQLHSCLWLSERLQNFGFCMQSGPTDLHISYLFRVNNHSVLSEMLFYIQNKLH
jgi:hypothetical protein